MDEQLELYTVVFWKHTGHFFGQLAEVSAVASYGETLAELIDNIARMYPLVREPGAKLILVPAHEPESNEFVPAK